MNPIKIIGLSIILFFTKSSYSQVVHSITLNPTKDVGVSSFFPNSSFGDTSNLPIGKFGVYDGNGNLVTYDTRRAFLQFDLSSIPANAIITNAIFKVYQYASANIVTNANLAIPRVLNPWEESGVDAVTWNSQPNVAPGTPLNFNGNSTGWIQVQARTTVQQIVNGTITNYGWMLRLSTSEPTAAINNRFTRSKEHVNQAQRPQLVVDYYIPMVVTDAIINHQDGATSNGSIEPVLENGPGGTITYKWYDSSGNLLNTSTTSPNLTNIPAGWYGLEVTSNKYASLPFYTSFIVGQKCSDHSFVFEPGSKFMDDIVISSLNNGTSYGGTSPIAIEDATDERYMLMKFHLWIPEDLEIVQADFTIKMGAQCLNTNPNNSLYLFKITSGAWLEDFVTYYSYTAFSEPNPNEAQNSLLTIPPSAAGGNAPFHTLDAINLFNSMKDDNQNNYGFISRFVHVNNTLKRAQYYSSRGGDPTLRPKVNFKVRVKESITSAWDSDNDKGKIFVDINGICDKVGPYHYFISTDSIPSLDETYTILNDSLNLGIDSVQFFTGKEPKSTYSFEHLPADNYYVSVFDSRGLRIMNKQATVFPPIDSVSISNGINVISKTQVKGTLANSTAFLDMYLYNRDEGEITFKLNSITQDTLTQYFGMTNLALESIAWSKLAYGFLIDRGSLVVCSSTGTSMNSLTQTLTSSNAVINSNSIFKIKVQNGEISFFHNNNLLKSDLLPEIYDLKGAVGLKSDNILEVKTKGLFAKKIVRATVKITEYPTCSQNSGTFGFGVAFPNNDYISYTVTNLSNSTLVGSGNISWDNQNTPVFSGYPAGIYEITISYAGGGALIESHYVYLGYQTEWSDVENYDFTPNTYSVERNGTNLSYGVAGHARSVNVLPYNQDGWVKFTPKVGVEATPTNYYSMLRFSTMNPITNSLLASNNENGILYFIRPFQSNVSYWSYKSGANSFDYDFYYPSVFNQKNYLASFSASNNVQFTELAWPTNAIPITNPNILVGARTPGVTRIRANSFKEFDGFYDVVTSFGCPQPQGLAQISYTELKRDVSGGFSYAVEGKIKFTLDEQYEMETGKFLPLKIYNKDHQIIASSDIDGNLLNAGIIVQNLEFDDNRWILDISDIPGITIGEHYILQVENEKGDKRYMRFLYKN